MIKSIDERMTEVITDSNTTKEQLEFFVARLQKNQSLSDSKAMKSLISCFIAFVLWFVIKSALINKLNLLGMEFVDLGRLLPILPPIAAFFYYNYIGELAFSQTVELALRSYYSQKFKTFDERALTELLEPSTITNIENAFCNLLREENDLLYKITNVWTIFVWLAIVFIPVIFISWMAYSLLTLTIVSIWWSITSIILAFVFVIRSLFLIHLYTKFLN